MNTEDKNEVLNSRGDVRLAYLKDFLASRLKEKGQLKRQEVVEEKASVKEDKVKFYEWHFWRMKKEWGEDRAQAIIDLPKDDEGALSWIPCPQTKKMSIHTGSGSFRFTR
jgi:hypothetical protein